MSTTLYVDKHGNLSTVDPNAPKHAYYRPGFGYVVSS